MRGAPRAVSENRRKQFETGNTYQVVCGLPKCAAISCVVSSTSTDATSPEPGQGRRQEIRVFLFLALVLVPLLSVLFVAGYGFVVWIWQMFAGPPGPPPP